MTYQKKDKKTENVNTNKDNLHKINKEIYEKFYSEYDYKCFLTTEEEMAMNIDYEKYIEYLKGLK